MVLVWGKIFHMLGLIVLYLQQVMVAVVLVKIEVGQLDFWHVLLSLFLASTIFSFIICYI